MQIDGIWSDCDYAKIEKYYFIDDQRMYFSKHKIRWSSKQLITITFLYDHREQTDDLCYFFLSL